MNKDIVSTERLGNAREFYAALQPDDARWGKELDQARMWVFRGQSNSNWSLLPSAFRKIPKTAAFGMPAKSMREQIKAERNALWSFASDCDRSGVDVPGDQRLLRSTEYFGSHRDEARMANLPWPYGEWEELASLAQHHGVPTRILDWTRSAKIAAYFASEEVLGRFSDRKIDSQTIEELEESEICVWGCHTFMAVKRTIGGEGIRLFGAATSHNKFIHAQQGVFLVPHNTNTQLSNDPWEPQPFDEWLIQRAGENTEPLLRKLTLPALHAFELLNRLEHDNIDHATVFPGPIGAAEATYRSNLLRSLCVQIRSARPDTCWNP